MKELFVCCEDPPESHSHSTVRADETRSERPAETPDGGDQDLPDDLSEVFALGDFFGSDSRLQKASSEGFAGTAPVYVLVPDARKQ